MILVLSTEQDSDAQVRRALQEARASSEPLEIFYVVETTLPQTVSSWFMYLGFMGEKPAEELKNLILGELRRRAKERVQELQAQLRSASVPGEVHLVEGDPEEIRERLRKEYPDQRLLP